MPLLAISGGEGTSLLMMAEFVHIAKTNNLAMPGLRRNQIGWVYKLGDAGDALSGTSLCCGTNQWRRGGVERIRFR